MSLNKGTVKAKDVEAINQQDVTTIKEALGLADPLLTKEKIEENQVLNIEEFYQYNLVSRLINDGIINNLGTINIL